jgi:starch synthase
LNICFITAELAPLAKAGGLADVSAALLKYLSAGGHDLRLFMPAHSAIDRSQLELHTVDFLHGLEQQIGLQRYRYSVLTARLPGTDAWFYLIDCPEAFDRPGIYTAAADEYRRFLLLTHAAFACCQRMGFAPDIIHCNDWHTAMAPLWLDTIYHWDSLFAHTRSVLTIHNVGYQGVQPAAAAGELLPAPDLGALHQEELRAGRINMLRHGVMYADAITAVSPTYAREITTPEYGLGLEDTLRARGTAVVGILNGVDYSIWDPRVDPYLPLHFNAAKLHLKAQLKLQLQQRLGLAPLLPAQRVPLVGVVSRLVAQKGFELLRDCLPPLVAAGRLQLAVLGSGEAPLEEFFAVLARLHPQAVHFHRGYSEELAHWIEAGSDMFLMPSRYEPCGLNQMYSLRYGTAPIVRRTGGLADTVQHFDAATGQGTGVVFEHFDGVGMAWALDYALGLYQQRGAWRRLVQNGMAQDFSWQHQVGEYTALYQRLAKS